jgi:Cu-processing system permease protein
MKAPIITIAAMEFTAAARLRWIRLFSIAYAFTTIAMAHASSVFTGQEDGETFARLTVALQPLALTLVPLAALLVGVSTMPNDPEASGFLLSQPVSIAEILVGRWMGQAGALVAALAVGFGAGGLMVLGGGAAGFGRFLILVAGCAVLTLAFLSLAALVAALASSRGTAIGMVTFLWFLAVILYDAIAIAAALWLTGRAGTRLLFASVFGNAVDLVRILVLTLAGTPQILGTAGESWMRALGGNQAACALAALALTGWIVVPLALSIHVLRSRDL